MTTLLQLGVYTEEEEQILSLDMLQGKGTHEKLELQGLEPKKQKITTKEDIEK